MSNIPNYDLWSYQPTPLAPQPQTQRPRSHRHEHPPRQSPQPFARLNRAAFANLSPIDQILFQHFGVGRASEPAYDTMHEAFAAQAAAQPAAIAAEHLGQQISYGELNRQAERLAAHLTTLGVQPGDNVALFLQRSIPMLVGIMAILKAGAAYVPQHAGIAPEAQLRHILAVANIRVVLTLSHLQETVPSPDGCLLLCIDEFMAAADGIPAVPFAPARPARRDDNCFILFTSGTTGPPNGVQVTHGNVANIILTEPGRLGMAPGRRVGQILSIAFDMAAWEILGSLAHGATLVIRGKEFAPVVESVDVIIATPTILSGFAADRCQQARFVAVAGEPCPRPLADKWARFCTFYNACGPTETTIVNTMLPHQPDKDRLTIGKPTPNNTVYVLNEQMEPCAIGEIGEMWAGGDCVSAGYLANDELNAERYRPDPFLGGGRLMFRTRDLGRWTPDGELEHFGRTDDQVKVRGFRVELDSVSALLEKSPGCVRAVTLKYDDRDLVAFVSPANVDTTAAREAVAAALPYYAVPAHVFALPELPRTSRGKIDKRLLLALAEAEINQLAAQPALMGAE